MSAVRFDPSVLNPARQHAEAGRFAEFRALCLQVAADWQADLVAQLDIGALLLSHGLLSDAYACFALAQRIAPSDLRASVNLANLARDVGQHGKASRMYAELLLHLPDNPVIRRNALTGLEYDPHATAQERLQQARAWGEWAIAQAGGKRPRPALTPQLERPLRVGYVSADLCNHTVGLFVKDVFAAHDASRVQVFAYSTTPSTDWVNQAIRAACTLRDVAALDDAALAAQIRADRIDVLVDLSGHTAGSRLTAFAHRPAPVMVSWLGYFASTGLSYIDAVLLDEWHAPPEIEEQFVEPVMHLPVGRFYYQAMPWAPPEAPSPFKHKGHLTFGCFNNTAKLNGDVFDVWAQVLAGVPHSRLVLKWRTFNDEVFRQSVTEAFVARGIAAERIELRGPSFHADLLREYADIDIALDPFPFTGGLTSCEALWMGVPVVTLPQGRVVSRQTFAFLNQIGLPDLAARDAQDYVRIAVALANDPQRLVELRSGLRKCMQTSALMDVTGFTQQFEASLIALYQRVGAEEAARPMNNTRTILHVGPGHRSNGAKLPAAFQGSEWQEVRLDIDPANEPDIIGSMLDMPDVANASVDALYSSHNIEHVYAHEVPQVLKEFLRVLKPDGFLVVTCPDLQTVCQLVAEDKLNDAAYVSPAGPITPLDILYGHGDAIAAGNHYMAHKCGFTLKTLNQALQAAGFAISAGKRRLRGLDLWVVASKGPMDEAAVLELAGQVLPD
ncbi:methyltransferase domain-containing protein [Pseudomonas putida]|uniref:O-linked N-acetylglucosamine transferase family protein n=1 Tax=Pseudomonas putida TaxID=303 RepID=UPI003709FA9D